MSWTLTPGHCVARCSTFEMVGKSECMANAAVVRMVTTSIPHRLGSHPICRLLGPTTNPIKSTMTWPHGKILSCSAEHDVYCEAPSAFLLLHRNTG